MRFTGVLLIALLTLSLGAFASDPQPSVSEQANTLDSKMILPATAQRTRTAGADNDRACFSMRTYRVRTDMDRGSVLPATPSEVAFDPNDIVGYSTCQRAQKYAVKSAK